MAYTIHFVGLIHFLDRGNDGKLVLMPDGRYPAPLIVSPHYSSFFIQDEDVLKSDWWDPFPDPVLKDLKVTEFRTLAPSKITVTGMEKAGNGGCRLFGPKLNSKGLKELPELEHDRKLQIVPEWAQTITQMAIRQGTLDSYLFGGKIHGAGVSKLVVTEQSGPIVILARLDDGSGFKSLTLRGGTEIVLTNTSSLTVPHTDQDSHFRLYARLDVNRRDDTLKTKPPIPDLRPLPFNHRFLDWVLKNSGFVPNADCSNSCC